MLIPCSAAHLLVDAVCAATLFGSGAVDMAALLIVYNTLAFSSQCLVGLALDSWGRQRLFAFAACLAVALGFILPLPAMVRAVIAAAGNSFFHVAAGTLVLQASRGRAAPLGVFVAPGSIGLALGTLCPGLGIFFALALAGCAPLLLREQPSADARRGPEPAGGSTPAAAVLLLAVAARALGGSAVSFPWQGAGALPLAAALCVLAGKTAGGFICDALGAKKTALLSLPAAALLIAFFSWSLPLSLLGQFLLNLTMPVTLYLIYKALPDAPGFAFGLAASVLWPGTVVGQLIAPAGPAVLLLCFSLGLAAILKGERHE